MDTTRLLEVLGGFAAASAALWAFGLRRPDPGVSEAAPWLRAAAARLSAYLSAPGLLASIGLLLLRLSVGVMMIHHGQEKLADPQQFADTYVASLHLPFPLVFAWAAGLSELVGSWLLILGLATPLGALMLSGTMAVAAYQHILTAGLNIYVLELVVLYLGASLALFCNGPGRLSLDGLALALIRRRPPASAMAPAAGQAMPAAVLQPVPIAQPSRQRPE